MKTIRTSLGFLLVFSLVASQSIAGSDDDQVTLQSKDGQDFTIDVKVAKKSVTIGNLIEEAGIEDPIHLPNITGKILFKLVEFMKNATERPFSSDRALLVYLRELLNEKDVSTTELLDVVRGVNYLDIRSQREGDVLNAALKLYGRRIFDHVELENLKRSASDAAYSSYAQAKLSLPNDLQKIVVRQSLQSIDRIFVDTSRDRRLHAIEKTPLGVAQIIAYIAKNQTPNAAVLPEVLRNVLIKWQGKDYASKIHFGPWPIEFATWPGHCPLPSDPNYNMYSDNTPNDRFIDNGDGTATDVCTRLTWEQTPSTPAGPWQQAKDHCASLNKTDPTGWRTPTRIELQSIVSYSATNPALNRIFGEGNAPFWSSSPTVGYWSQAWIVNFESGDIGVRGVAKNNGMRCVRGERGGPPSTGAMKHYDYTEHSETATDNFTGAVWQRSVIDVGRHNAGAQEYCTNILGNRWLLPTVKMLSTLVDVTVGSPRIDRAAFPDTPKLWFWSSSVRVGKPNFAWVIGFSDGSVYDDRVGFDVRARCVR